GGYGGGGAGGAAGADAGGGGGGSVGPNGAVISVASNAGAANTAGGNGSIALTYADAVAAPAPIPTLSQWGLVLMAGLLGLFAAGTMRRRR
ncbi:IPTL-CTERM sorting domain-containing protein, partial [Paracidovorax avenae]